MNLKFRISLIFMIVVGIASLLQGVVRQISLMNSIVGGPYLSEPSFAVLATSTPPYFLPESSAEARPRPESSAEVLPVGSIDREQYSPAHYGIPEMLAGLEVVAVVTRAQNPCMPSGDLLVMIHISEDVEVTSLTQTLANAEAELKAINPNAIITGAGPMEDRDAFFNKLAQDHRTRQRDAAAGRCGQVFGGSSSVSGDRVVLFPTPTPDTSFLNPESSAEVLPVDRQKYSPARYGIPQTLGGFRVLAVTTYEYNPCLPKDFIHVTLQGVDASSEEYQKTSTPTDISKALNELHLLYPNASLSYGGFVEDEAAYLSQLEANSVQTHQVFATEGCVRIRSGPIILDPTYQMTAEAEVSEPFEMIVTATPLR